MKSKAHYKKCVELGVVPVPTTVCDENIDKEAIAYLAAGGNTEESSEEEEDSDADESEESGSEEQEAAQGLLSLSQRNTDRLPGLIPTGRPTTYPYTLNSASTSTLVTLNAFTTNVTSTLNDQNTNNTTGVIQNELPHRYYFPSNRSAQEGSRTSVIHSAKKNSGGTEPVYLKHHFSQPMDLTTKQIIQTPVAQRAKPTDILTPVSEPVLLQTIVQTMERLPIQGREWKPEADGHMLQAYLTERHVMDSRIKQQYRVGNTKHVRDNQETYLNHQDLIRLKIHETNHIPTMTYTESNVEGQYSIVENRIKISSMIHAKVDDNQADFRESIHRSSISNDRSLDYQYKDKTNRSFNDKENPHGSSTSSGNNRRADYVSTIINHNSERVNHIKNSSSSQNILNIDSTKTFNLEMNRLTTASETDRSSMMFSNVKMTSEIDKTRESHDRSTPTDSKTPSPRNMDARSPCRPIQDYRAQNRDMRGCNQDFKSPGLESKTSNREGLPINTSDSRSSIISEYRPQSRESKPNFDVLTPVLHDTSKLKDGSRSQIEMRNPERVEVKFPIEMTKQCAPDNIQHAIVPRKMVVGSSGFRSPSPTIGSNKPQAEFLQPSSGPAPNYVR